MSLVDLLLTLLKDPEAAKIIAAGGLSPFKPFTVSYGIFYPGPLNYYLGVAHVDPGGRVEGAFSHLKAYSIVRRTWKTDRMEWDEWHSKKSKPTDLSQK